MGGCINEIQEDTSNYSDCIDDEDGPYIEIELDNEPPTCYNDDVVAQEEEYQLRISISSTISVTLQEVQKESTSVHSSEPKVDEIGAPIPCIPSLVNCSADEVGSEIEFPEQNQLFSTVSFNPRPRGLWEIPQPDGQTTILGTSTTRVISYDTVDGYARKQSSLTTTTTTNGIMMKLLIKFRGTKIGALFASLIKPRQPCQVNNVHKSSKKSKTFFQCYDQIGRRDQGNSKRFCRVMEMDLGALRGVLNAMGMSNGQRGSKSKRRTGSTSCNTSPSHDEGISLCSHENSIQAAIAYCKSSLGQTSDFTFTSSISSSPSRFVA